MRHAVKQPVTVLAKSVGLSRAKRRNINRELTEIFDSEIGADAIHQSGACWPKMQDAGMYVHLCEERARGALVLGEQGWGDLLTSPYPASSLVYSNSLSVKRRYYEQHRGKPIETIRLRCAD